MIAMRMEALIIKIMLFFSLLLCLREQKNVLPPQITQQTLAAPRKRRDFWTILVTGLAIRAL